MQAINMAFEMLTGIDLNPTVYFGDSFAEVK